MPKKVNHSWAEGEIKKLLGLPSYVSILSLGVYEKEYYSQKFGWRRYFYYRLHYYDPTTKRVYRKHLREKDRERKGKVLNLWRIEQKLRKGEPLGGGDLHFRKLLLEV